MSDFGTPPPPPPPPPRFPEPPPLIPPVGRLGPPWEAAGQSLQSFIDTAKGVLTDPVPAFSQMRREGGLVPPLIYYLIGVIVGGLGSFLWQFAGFGLGMPFGGVDPTAAMTLGAVFISVPIVCTIGIFIGSGIIHFALGLFGGQRYPFETTFRTLAYAYGSAMPVAILPFCGGMVAAVWALIVASVGLAQMQETTTGKAAAAVLTPTVLCCGLWIVFWATFVTFIVGGTTLGALFGQ